MANLDDDFNMSNDSSQADVNNPEFDSQGKVEISAISNANQALQIARRLERDDEKRDMDRARVLAAFNGNAPYSDTELLAAAQSYRFNVSFGFIEGVIGRATVPYHELINDSQQVADIEGDLPKAKLNIIQSELTDAFMRWGKWKKTMAREIQDMVLNGYNSMLFPSDYDPWPVFVPQKNGFVHELTGNDADDVELFVWKKSYMIHELYKKIVDEEAATKAGWDVENVRKALENATPEEIRNNNRQGEWTKLESAIRGGTMWNSVVGGKHIQTFHVFASEADGQVSQYIVWDGKGRADEESPNVKLFKRKNRFKSMSDILVYYDLEAGDGYWHGSRGLGKRSFNTHRSIDKLRCSILDQAFTSGLTLLQAGDQSSQEDFQLAVTGPFAVIPAGITIADSTIPAISGTTFQADGLLSATSEQRIGDIVPSTTSALRQTRKSATEANIAANRAELISKSNLLRFMEPVSKTITIILQRLLKENTPDPDAREFQKRLKDRGITPEDLKKIRGAKSNGKINAALGDESSKITEIFQAFRGDPGVDQIELRRRFMAAILGPNDIEGLLIEAEDKTREIEATRQQMEEIGTILEGIPVPVSPRDNHEIHSKVGLDWLEGQIQSQSQGQEGAPMEILDEVAKHVGGHIQYLHEDKMKKQIAGEFEQRLKQIGNVLDKIEQASQKQQQQQALAMQQATIQAPLPPTLSL